MNTQTLSPRALKVIDEYLHFRLAHSVASVPYFNNKTTRARMTLRARVGKGSPKDILEELQAVIVKNHIVADTLADESLKKLLVDNGLGVDCSAFAYYVLDAENRERGLGRLNRRLTFMTGRSPMAKMRSYLRPVENCDVKTLGSDTNSRVIPLNEIRPGDFITMIGGPLGQDRDHIVIVHEVECANGSPKSVHYSHAVAYPEDGLYGTGIKQGKIEIASFEEELAKLARGSKTELRRLKWLS